MCKDVIVTDSSPGGASAVLARQVLTSSVAETLPMLPIAAAPDGDEMREPGSGSV
jgi:hypothetical protein